MLPGKWAIRQAGLEKFQTRQIMEISDRDTARRILSAVLERLEGESRNSSGNASDSSANQALSAQSPSSNAARPAAGEGFSPVIFVMLNQPVSQSNDGKNEKENGVLGDKASTQTVGIHPGLEKFKVTENASEASAPKACFMEPNRLCIGSGACQMRGY